MSTRMAGELTPPPSFALLGGRFEHFDADAKTLINSFDAREEFCNPAGLIQGGVLAAMCDDTMGPLVMFVARGEKFPSTTDLHTIYLRPVRPGPRVQVRARVERLGRTVAFTTAELYDASERLCVRCVQTAALVDFTRGREK